MILIFNYVFTPSTSNTTKGHTMKLFKHHITSYTRSKFFGNRVINDWKSLPQFIVDSPSVNEFKMLLDRPHAVTIYLISHSIYYIAICSNFWMLIRLYPSL